MCLQLHVNQRGVATDKHVTVENLYTGARKSFENTPLGASGDLKKLHGQLPEEFTQQPLTIVTAGEAARKETRYLAQLKQDETLSKTLPDRVAASPLASALRGPAAGVFTALVVPTEDAFKTDDPGKKRELAMANQSYQLGNP